MGSWIRNISTTNMAKESRIISNGIMDQKHINNHYGKRIESDYFTTFLSNFPFRTTRGWLIGNCHVGLNIPSMFLYNLTLIKTYRLVQPRLPRQYLCKQYLALAKTLKLMNKKHGCFMEVHVTFKTKTFPRALLRSCSSPFTLKESLEFG